MALKNVKLLGTTPCNKSLEGFTPGVWLQGVVPCIV